MKNLYERIDVIQKSIEEKNSNEINDFLNELRDDMLLYCEYEEDNEEKILEEIEEEVKQYIKGTNEIPIRISIHSDWDIKNSHWFENKCGYSYEDNYLKTIIDVLNLNPYKVGELLKENEYNVINDFPNLVEREGEEKINYEDFIKELENDSCGGSLTFLCNISLEDLLEKEFNLNKIRIPIGCYCGIFNSFAGGGSIMELKTTKEIVLENNEEINFQITIDDKKDTYSFSNVYGIIQSYYFNKNLLID